MDKLEVMNKIKADITDIETLRSVLENRIKFNLEELQRISMSIDSESNNYRIKMVHENNLMYELLAQIK